MKKVVVAGILTILTSSAMDQPYQPLYDVDAFKAVQTIQHTVDEWLDSSLKDRTIEFHMAHDEHDTVHHHMRQTRQGIIIEWALCQANKEKKVPRELWTPWGKVPLVGAISGNCTPIVDRLRRLLVVDTYKGDVMPYLPGIYETVHVCDRTLLAPAQLLHPLEQRPLAQVQAAWKTLLQHDLNQ